MRYRFQFPYADSPILIWGNLIAETDEGAEVARFRATSGQRTFQSIGQVWTRGKGAIPPCAETVVGYYTINAPYYSEKLGGNFYHITPDPIISINGMFERCEIGIHSENDKPGSAGCPVIPNIAVVDSISDFERFERVWEEHGQKTATLIVERS